MKKKKTRGGSMAGSGKCACGEGQGGAVMQVNVNYNLHTCGKNKKCEGFSFAFL